jgi:hypothetical protein
VLGNQSQVVRTQQVQKFLFLRRGEGQVGFHAVVARRLDLFEQRPHGFTERFEVGLGSPQNGQKNRMRMVGRLGS